VLSVDNGICIHQENEIEEFNGLDKSGVDILASVMYSLGIVRMGEGFYGGC